jgi:hypothetical protein
MLAVDGEGRSGSGESAKPAIRKPHLCECGVCDVWRRSAGDEWNADPEADRSAEVGTLLLKETDPDSVYRCGALTESGRQAIAPSGQATKGFCRGSRRASPGGHRLLLLELRSLGLLDEERAAGFLGRA